jgi:phage shock protein A
MAQQTRAAAGAARAATAERGAAAERGPGADEPSSAGESTATALALRRLAAERDSQRAACAARARDERGNAEEWRRRAELAIAANDDDLAREALSRAREHEQLRALHARDAETARRIIDELFVAASELESPSDRADRTRRPR